MKTAKKKCQVCHSIIGKSIFSKQIFSKDYFLCSKHCEFVFSQRPENYTSGKDIELFKKRNIIISNSGDIKEIKIVIRSLKGVRDCFDINPDKISIEYNLYIIPFENILKTLRIRNFAINDSWILKVKEYFVNFLETNELDSLTAKASCCKRIV